MRVRADACPCLALCWASSLKTMRDNEPYSRRCKVHPAWLRRVVDLCGKIDPTPRKAWPSMVATGKLCGKIAWTWPKRRASPALLSGAIISNPSNKQIRKMEARFTECHCGEIEFARPCNWCPALVCSCCAAYEWHKDLGARKSCSSCLMLVPGIEPWRRLPGNGNGVYAWGLNYSRAYHRPTPAAPVDQI